MNFLIDMELVINFSGGKDSSLMLALLCEQYPDVPKRVVMADTGWEHPDAVEWSRDIVSLFGLELEVVQAVRKSGEANSFFKMVEHRGMFPGMQQRQCTSDLKRGPIQKMIRNIPSSEKRPVYVNCIGYRSEESRDRAKKKCIVLNKLLTNSKRIVWDYHPILAWKKADVFRYLKERLIPVHPVYNHLGRFSCRVCIYMTPHDLNQVAKFDPEAIKIIDRTEKDIGFTMFMSGPIGTIINTDHEQATHSASPVADQSAG